MNSLIKKISNRNLYGKQKWFIVDENNNIIEAFRNKMTLNRYLAKKKEIGGKIDSLFIKHASEIGV